MEADVSASAGLIENDFDKVDLYERLLSKDKSRDLDEDLVELLQKKKREAYERIFSYRLDYLRKAVQDGSTPLQQLLREVFEGI